jgi:hypothetical protein
MKRLVTLVILFSIILTGSSFKIKRRGHTEQFKNDGYLQAIIDGKVFEQRDDNKYTAELVNKSSDLPFNNSPNARITRVANCVTFYGSDFKDADGNTFTESVGFDYAFAEGALGDAAEGRITLNYDNQKFYNIEGETKFKITKIQWSSDRRYFVMNADFECKMRRWGKPALSQPVLKLKGQMENITVTVPSWVVLKNPTSVAEK